MTVYHLDNNVPRIEEDVFVAPDADVIGRVILEEKSSVWYGCVLRGDIEMIRVGRLSNIQDLSVIHTEHDMPAIIGSGVTVGHQACIHGARIGDGCLVGMGATILSGAEVGEQSIIAAGSLVPEGKSIPSGVLAMGIPCRVKRDLTDLEIRDLQQSAEHYVEYASLHREKLEPSVPPRRSA